MVRAARARSVGDPPDVGCLAHRFRRMSAMNDDTAKPADGEEGAEVRFDRIHANGIRFHVARRRPARRAPLVLFLHGFPECWYSWRHQLAAFGDRFDCAAPDLRGYGRTDKPKDGYTIDTLADDIAALVGALGHRRAVIVGHDWGGAIAWHTALRHPEVVSRIAVLNCPPVDVLVGSWLRSFRQLKRSWYILFFQLPLLPEHRLTKGAGAIVPRLFLAGAKRRQAFTRADLETFRQELTRPGAARGALAYYRQAIQSVGQARRAHAAARERGGIAAPGLLIWGSGDPFLGQGLTYGLEDRFAGSFSVVYLRGVGHWTQQEAPDEVNRALERFLGPER